MATGVIIGNDCYNGRSYGQTQNLKLGLNTNTISGASSIQIPAGYRATLYTGNNKNGNSITVYSYTSDTGCFGNLDSGGRGHAYYNDNVRSVLVEQVPIFYSTSYTIIPLSFVYNYNIGYLQFPRVTPTISSINLSPQSAVMFCNGTNYNAGDATGAIYNILFNNTSTSRNVVTLPDISEYKSAYVFINNQTPYPEIKKPSAPVVRAAAVTGVAPFVGSAAVVVPAPLQVVAPIVRQAPIADPGPTYVTVPSSVTNKRMNRQDAFPHSWIGNSVALPSTISRNALLQGPSDCENACLNVGSCAYSVFNTSSHQCLLYDATQPTLQTPKIPNTVMAFKS